MEKRGVLLFARGIALLWAAFWVYFVVASELSEQVDVGRKAFVILIGSLVFLVGPIMALVSRRAGGWILLIEGMLALCTVFYYTQNPPMTKLFLLLTLALPPLLSGWCLLRPFFSSSSAPSR